MVSVKWTLKSKQSQPSPPTIATESYGYALTGRVERLSANHPPVAPLRLQACRDTARSLGYPLAVVSLLSSDQHRPLIALKQAHHTNPYDCMKLIMRNKQDPQEQNRKLVDWPVGGAWHKSVYSRRLYCILGERIPVPDGTVSVLCSGGDEAKLLTVGAALAGGGGGGGLVWSWWWSTGLVHCRFCTPPLGVRSSCAVPETAIGASPVCDVHWKCCNGSARIGQLVSGRPPTCLHSSGRMGPIQMKHIQVQVWRKALYALSFMALELIFRLRHRNPSVLLALFTTLLWLSQSIFCCMVMPRYLTLETESRVWPRSSHE